MTTMERLSLSKDAPALYRAYLAFDRAVGEAGLEKPLAELVKLRASQLNGCAYCVDMHTHDAMAAGESTRKLFAVTAWEESPLFDDRERAAFAFTDAVTRMEGIDAAYEAAAEHFSTEELAALLYAIVAVNGWNRLAVATHAVYEP